MSKLVRGDQLPSDLKREILSKYPYRWTSDNSERERVWRNIEGKPTIPLVSDTQWLREHAFYVTDRGTLDKRRNKHAEPAYLIETETHHSTMKKSPAQLQREIDEALGKPTNGGNIANQLTERDRSTLAWVIEDWPWPYRGQPTADMDRLIAFGLVAPTKEDEWGGPTTLGLAVWARVRKTWIDEHSLGAAFRRKG